MRKKTRGKNKRNRAKFTNHCFGVIIEIDTFSRNDNLVLRRGHNNNNNNNNNNNITSVRSHILIFTRITYIDLQ